MSNNTDILGRPIYHPSPARVEDRAHVLLVAGEGKFFTDFEDVAEAAFERWCAVRPGEVAWLVGGDLYQEG